LNRKAWLIALALAACASPRAAPVANTTSSSSPPPELFSELIAIDAGLCACAHAEGDAIDEGCAQPFIDRYNAWVHATERARERLPPDQHARLLEIDEHAHRCFQAAIGDPLPPKRR
jgi:hypothetical protein